MGRSAAARCWTAPSAWSANGRWLVAALPYLATSGTQNLGSPYRLLDVATGRLAHGTVLVLPRPAPAGGLVALDLSTGTVRQRYGLGSRAQEKTLTVAAAYSGVVLLTHRPPAGDVDAIYTFDVRTATLHRTTDVPGTVRYVSLPGQVDRATLA
jgi:hypothetical protein